MKKTISKFLLGILVLTSITSVFAADTTTQVVIEGTNVNVTNTSGGSTTVNSTSGGGASVTLPGTTTVVSYGSAANSIVSDFIARNVPYKIDDINGDSVPDIVTSAGCPLIKVCPDSGGGLYYFTFYIYNIQKGAYEMYKDISVESSLSPVFYATRPSGYLRYIYTLKNYIVYDSFGRGRLYFASGKVRVTEDPSYSVLETVNYTSTEQDTNGDGFTDVRLAGVDYLYNAKKQKYISNDLTGNTQTLSGLVGADKTESSDFNNDGLTDMIFTTTSPTGQVTKSYYVGQSNGGYKGSLTTDTVNSVSYINVNPVVDSVKDIVSITTDTTTGKDSVRLDVYNSATSTYLQKTPVEGVVVDSYNFKDMNADGSLDLVTILGTTIHVYYYNVAGMVESISYDLTAKKDDISFLQIGGSSHIDMITKKKVGTFNSVIYYEWEIYIYDGTTFVKKSTSGQLLGKAFTWYSDINTDGQTDFYIDIGTVNSYYYSQRSTGNIKFLHSMAGLPRYLATGKGQTPIFVVSSRGTIYNLKGDLATTSFTVKVNGVTQTMNNLNNYFVSWDGYRMEYNSCYDSMVACSPSLQETYKLLGPDYYWCPYTAGPLLTYPEFTGRREQVDSGTCNNRMYHNIYGRTGSDPIQTDGYIYLATPGYGGDTTLLVTVPSNATENNLDYVMVNSSVSWVGAYRGTNRIALSNMNRVLNCTTELYQAACGSDVNSNWGTSSSYYWEGVSSWNNVSISNDVMKHITGSPRKSYSTMQ